MFRWLASAVFIASAVAQEPVIRVNVNLVRMVATVRNVSGDLVGTLGKNDFEIADNGVRQEIAVFDRESSQPLSIALMVDTSGSTAKELKFEVESATRFLHALLATGHPEDSVALYSFNWQIERQNYFTHNASSLEKSMKTLHGEAGTSLYDAIYLAAQDLESRQGRKVMIIVTDGGDTTSSTTLKRALEAAQLADAVIYPLIIMPITNDAGRNIGGENALTFMAQGTGGRTFLPTVGAELDRAFEDIISELRTQYVLGFYPRNLPPTKERFHQLTVRLTRPELRVSARNGYYGDSERETADESAARIAVEPDRTVKKKPAKK
jgi:Ca-activated chloride channel family protein